MAARRSLDELYNSAPLEGSVFQNHQTVGLPASARQYLEHAIAPGTRLTSAVHLRMHGDIKLGKWLPFTAEQVIRHDGEMIWSATVRMAGLPITGSDQFVGGEGAMRWKLFGIIPIIAASGPDITRSAIGRVEAETIWLPSVLCGKQVDWTKSEPFTAHAEFMIQDERAHLDLGIDETGKLKSVSLPRWGNPEGEKFHYSNCGGYVEDEGTFDGYTIPTRMRIGWHFGTERFETDGEFFRVTIDNAIYR